MSFCEFSKKKENIKKYLFYIHPLPFKFSMHKISSLIFEIEFYLLLLLLLRPRLRPRASILNNI